MEIVENNVFVSIVNNNLEVSEPQVITDEQMKLYVEEFQLMEIFND